MSRCFPFPPPGYEKKARVDDTDLITKEKRKEKRHKKDKDKEKKEGKEKKDKDRSKDKHREKKDRKEKHKDNEDRKEKHRDKDKDRDKEKNRILDDQRVEGQPGFYNGEKVAPSSLQNNDIKDFKYVQELARRISNDNGASGSQMVQKIVATDHKKAELPGTSVGSIIGNQSEEGGRIKNRNEDHRKANGKRSHIDPRSSEKAFGQNFSAMDQERGVTKLSEKKDAEKVVVGREKGKHKESDGKSEKEKGKDQEKHRKSKDKNREKEKKKEDRAKKMAMQSTDQPKLKDSGSKLKESSKDSLDIPDIKPLNPINSCSTSSIAEGNLGKRKELEINGSILDNGNRPNKILRPPSTSRPVTENGSEPEESQKPIRLGFEQGAAHGGDVKEHKINGLIMAQPPDTSSTKPILANLAVKENGVAPARPPHPDVKEQKINGLVMAQPPKTSSTRPDKVAVRENSEAPARPPHPDTKYLNQILSVPKLEEWPDGDDTDQEWLFSNKHLQSKEPDCKSPGMDRTRQVWAEAMWMDSADISALPYVIPY